MKAIYVERYLPLKRIILKVNPFPNSKYSLVMRDNLRPAVRQLLEQDFDLLISNNDCSELNEEDYEKAVKDFDETLDLLRAILDSTSIKPLNETEAMAILENFGEEYYNSIADDLGIAVGMAEWSNLDDVLSIDKRGFIADLVKANVIERGGKYVYHRGEDTFTLTGNIVEVLDIMQSPLTELDFQYLSAVVSRDFWEDEPMMFNNEVKSKVNKLLADWQK